jgi:hypothetical protein
VAGPLILKDGKYIELRICDNKISTLRIDARQRSFALRLQKLPIGNLRKNAGSSPKDLWG